MKKAASAIAFTFAFALLGSAVIGLQSVKANSQTLTVPDDYSTIESAIAKANNGDTVFVKKGTYEGPANKTLVIEKSISVVGEDAESTIINLHPPLASQDFFSYSFIVYMNSVNIEADNVQLNSLTIRSDRISSLWGNGGAISLVVDSVQITGSMLNTSIYGRGNGTLIRNNKVVAINLQGDGQIIKNNTVAGEVGEGEYLVSCAGSNNTVEANKVSGGIGGICVSGSGNYIIGNSVNTSNPLYVDLAVGGERNRICDNNVTILVVDGQSNSFYGNRVVGVLGITGDSNVFYSNFLAGVGLGDTIHDASNNTFYRNNFVFGEAKTFTIWSGVKGNNFLDNGTMGNFWSDYDGSDWNLDGVGEMPYVIDAKDPLNYHYMVESDIADVVLTDHYPFMAALDISPASTPTQEPTPKSEFPIWLLITGYGTIIAVVVVLLYYFNKRFKDKKP